MVVTQHDGVTLPWFVHNKGKIMQIYHKIHIHIFHNTTLASNTVQGRNYDVQT